MNKNYVTHRVPSKSKKEQCKLVFDQLREDSKKDWVKIVTYQKPFLVITPLGKEYYQYLNSKN